MNFRAIGYKDGRQREIDQDRVQCQALVLEVYEPPCSTAIVCWLVRVQ
jgi:hypothetical protein